MIKRYFTSIMIVGAVATASASQKSIPGDQENNQQQFKTKAALKNKESNDLGRIISIGRNKFMSLENLDVRGFESQIVDRIRAESVTELHVQGSQFNPSKEFYKALVDAQNLTKVQLDQFSPAGNELQDLYALLSKLHGVKALEISGLDITNDGDPLRLSLCNNVSSLTRLDLSHIKGLNRIAPSLIRSVKNMQALQYVDCLYTDLANNQIVRFAEALEGLKHLTGVNMKMPYIYSNLLDHPWRSLTAMLSFSFAAYFNRTAETIDPNGRTTIITGDSSLLRQWVGFDTLFQLLTGKSSHSNFYLVHSNFLSIWWSGVPYVGVIATPFLAKCSLVASAVFASVYFGWPLLKDIKGEHGKHYDSVLNSLSRIPQLKNLTLQNFSYVSSGAVKKHREVFIKKKLKNLRVNKDNLNIYFKY